MHFIQIHSKQECKNSKLYITIEKYIQVSYYKYPQLCHIIKRCITMLLIQLFSLFPCNTCPVQCKCKMVLLHGRKNKQYEVLQKHTAITYV